MTNFNTNRKFGVELEFKGDKFAVARYMNEHGVPCEIESYGHYTRSHWKIVMDSSAEHELVSPPMKGEEAFRQLKVACDALEAAGAQVDKSCGLHVHHDAQDLSVKQFANIFALYVKLEETIDTFVPKSRRADNNTYCRTLASTAEEKNKVLKKLKSAKTIEEIANSIFRSRYVKVNAQSYIRHGTIEFRQHSGTTSYNKVYNWILLTQCIVERAVSGSVQYSYKESSFKLLTLQKMLGIIASSGADEQIQAVNNYYVKRAAEFSKAEQRAINNIALAAC